MQKDVAHHAELRESLETMRQMKEKYSTEIGHLHRMNEEALVAVRVAEYESGTEINRLREEYRTKYTQETGDMSARLQQLQAVVDASSAKYTQVALSLQHLLAYTVPLQAQLANLSKAYNTLKLLHQHSEKVTDGILSLAQCCRPQSTGVTTSEHSAAYKKDKGRGGMMLRGEYVFEPFLDPLEEVSAQRVHVKVTFRVAVIYVLAALRFQNILRVEKEYADEITSHLTAARSRAKESTGGVELSISLPAEKDLRALSSVQIARQLLDGAKSVAGATESPGNHLHLHQRMSMDEFDVYLANYERNFERRTSTSPGRAGKGSPLRKSKVSLFEALVSPNLRAAQQGSAATASSNIYHLRNVSLLYKTLSDMSNRVFKCGAENEQLQV